MYSLFHSVIALKSGIRVLLTLSIAVQSLVVTPLRAADATNDWKAEWDKTVKVAEQEGQVAYSGCGSHDYLNEFQKKYPRIKVVDVHPMMRRKEGVKYLEMWNPNWMNMKPVEKLVNQALGEAKKN